MYTNDKFFYKEETPIVPKELKKSVVNEAVDLLFPTADSKQKRLVAQYVRKQYSQLNCCVLYSKSKKFCNFCRKLDLDIVDIGTQEVVITENGSIRYTKNYKNMPMPT